MGTIRYPHSFSVTALLLWVLGAMTSVGQNALVDLPSISNGFSRASSIYAAPKSELEKGFTLTAGLATTYDSNVFQSPGSAANPIRDSVVVSPGFAVSYLAGSSSWLIGAGLAATYDEYLDTGEVSGLNYDASVFGGYRGGKLIVSFLSDFGFHSGINRFLAQNVEQFELSNRIIARYRISPKTALVGSVFQRSVFYQTKGINDTSLVDLSINALWNATPLLDIGPGIRYGIRTQESADDLSVIGPVLNLNYQLSTKVSLRSRVGIDFANSDLIDDTYVNWFLRLDYKASALWEMNLALLRDTQANPGNGGGFDEVTLFRLGYLRNIRRMKLNLGIALESRSTEGFTIAGGSNDSFDYLTYDLSLTVPLFKENLDATVSCRYRDNSSTRPGSSWDGVQTGLGLSWKF